MKQISYDFNMFEIMFSLMRDRTDIEDGYWEMAFRTETSSPVILPPMFQGQNMETLPGVLIRLVGVTMSKVSTSGPLTIEIRDGLIIIPRSDSDGIDTDNSRPVEGVESVGENSESVGKSIPRSKRKSR